MTTEWVCPSCGWIEKAHPKYGWARHNARAVEVHLTILCPVLNKKDK